MKLDKNRLAKCYYNAMLEQYTENLIEAGFTVRSEYKYGTFVFDLYAENNVEKKVYEFKLIGVKSQRHQRQIVEFKDMAKEINANPYIVYIKLPVEKEIIFDGLSEIINNYFLESEIPSSIDELSTHSSIDIVEVAEILSMEIDNSFINVTGLATIYVNLQYGSNFDLKNDNGDTTSADFPLQFKAVLSIEDLTISDMEYDIDTSSWYED